MLYYVCNQDIRTRPHLRKHQVFFAIYQCSLVKVVTSVSKVILMTILETSQNCGKITKIQSKTQTIVLFFTKQLKYF